MRHYAEHEEEEEDNRLTPQDEKVWSTRAYKLYHITSVLYRLVKYPPWVWGGKPDQYPEHANGVRQYARLALRALSHLQESKVWPAALSDGRVTGGNVLRWTRLLKSLTAPEAAPQAAQADGVGDLQSWAISMVRI